MTQKRILLAAACTAVAAFGVFNVLMLWIKVEVKPLTAPVAHVAPVKEVPMVQHEAAVVPPPPAPAVAPSTEAPVKLQIPKFNQNIEVIPMGITSTGILDTPHNFSQAGWYAAGTYPGQLGSAVIDAHVDNGAAIPGVFKRLRELQPGDYVYTIGSAGTMLRFRVVSSTSYLYKDVPTDELYNQADAAYLKLVTCDGTFMPAQKTYDKRLIVTAVYAP